MIGGGVCGVATGVFPLPESVTLVAMSGGATATFSLPKTEKGEVDFNALGNTLVETLLAQSMCISASDKKFGVPQVPQEPTISSGHSKWEFDYERDGLLVFKEKNKPSNLHSIASRGVVGAPYTLVSEFLKDPQSTFIWDNTLVEIKYLKTYAETSTHQDYLAYQLHSAMHCFSVIQRDMLYFLHFEYKRGKFIMTGISIEDDDYPPQKSVPRCEMHLGSGIVVEPFRGSNTSSLVTYVARGYLKDVPQLITTQLIRRHAMSVKYMQKSFENQESAEQTQASFSTSVLDNHHHSALAYEDHLPLNNFMGRTKKI